MQEGDVLDGKYRLDTRLGSGGMGVVFAATHLTLGTRVAVKLLLPDAAQSKDAVARFVHEAQAAAQIENDHVVRVTDVATSPGGAPYLVMELLRGEDLAAVLRRDGPLPIAQAVDWLIDACEAVAQAHARGIVHRDLKPSNLFLHRRPDGSQILKVLDFGISKATNAAASAFAITDTKSSLGTPLYMSPEQVRSAKSVDHRTDVWSLGVVLYELCAGGRPFDGESLPALCVAIANDPPRLLRERRPDVPEGLAEVVSRCLEKDVERRIANVADLARDLAPHGGAGARDAAARVVRTLSPPKPVAEGVSALAATVDAPATPRDAPREDARGVTQPAWGSTRTGIRRRVTPLAVFVALAGVGASLWYASARSRWTAPPPAPGAPSAALASAEPATAASTEGSASAAPPPAPSEGASAAPPASAPPRAPAGAPAGIAGSPSARPTPPTPHPRPLTTKPRHGTGDGTDDRN